MDQVLAWRRILVPRLTDQARTALSGPCWRGRRSLRFERHAYDLKLGSHGIPDRRNQEGMLESTAIRMPPSPTATEHADGRVASYLTAPVDALPMPQCPNPHFDRRPSGAAEHYNATWLGPSRICRGRTIGASGYPFSELGACGVAHLAACLCWLSQTVPSCGRSPAGSAQARWRLRPLANTRAVARAALVRSAGMKGRAPMCTAFIQPRNCASQLTPTM